MLTSLLGLDLQARDVWNLAIVAVSDDVAYAGTNGAEVFKATSGGSCDLWRALSAPGVRPARAAQARRSGGRGHV